MPIIRQRSLNNCNGKWHLENTFLFFQVENSKKGVHCVFMNHVQSHDSHTHTWHEYNTNHHHHHDDAMMMMMWYHCADGSHKHWCIEWRTKQINDVTKKKIIIIIRPDGAHTYWFFSHIFRLNNYLLLVKIVDDDHLVVVMNFEL